MTSLELFSWKSLRFKFKTRGHDLVSLFSIAGRRVKKALSRQVKEPTAKPSGTPAAIASSTPLSPAAVDHNVSFGAVYANDLAKDEITRDSPRFPVGSIIVREKNDTETSAAPLAVIAMVKRAKGFSSATNDWEFFQFDGRDLKPQKRETAGNCAACHIQAEKTDWVFNSHLR